MTTLLDAPRFARHFEALADVALNPGRHAADDARTHSRWVAQRAAVLGSANGRTEHEVVLLHALGLSHDIGKVAGDGRPAHSVALLREIGVTDAALLALVAVHDTNLPWYLSHQRGTPPSARAWRKLAAKIDMTLLCLFMVADRVDCPGGWRANPPLCWFLAEAERQGVLSAPLALDPPGDRYERSAGAVLVRGYEALLIRARADGYEIPKGKLSWDESLRGAALRELREETGVGGVRVEAAELDRLRYCYPSRKSTVHKTVHVFLARPDAGGLSLGEGAERTRWVSRGELDTLPLVDASLRPLLQRAFAEG